MEWTRMEMDAFAVIGREGSTKDGAGFIQRLWADADARFGEIAQLVLRDEAGRPVGLWGCMTDFGRNHLPWQNGYSEGLYLAGAQVADDAAAPEGWTKWTIPACEYRRAKGGGAETFSEGVKRLQTEGLSLVCAALDFHSPAENADYTYFPVRRL